MLTGQMTNLFAIDIVSRYADSIMKQSVTFLSKLREHTNFNQ